MELGVHEFFLCVHSSLGNGIFISVFPFTLFITSLVVTGTRAGRHLHYHDHPVTLSGQGWFQAIRRVSCSLKSRLWCVGAWELDGQPNLWARGAGIGAVFC